MTVLRVRLNQTDIGDAGVLAVNEYRKTVIRKAVEKVTRFKSGRMFGPFQEPTVDLLLADDVEIISDD